MGCRTPVARRRGATAVALDCEMVGIRGGRNAIVRVAVVNALGESLLDMYVMPDKPVADYRFSITGINARILAEKGALQVAEARNMLSAVLTTHM